MQTSHPLSDIYNVYAEVPETERAPLYWSAGLLLHPDFARITKKYQVDKHLSNNDTLWPLSWLSQGTSKSKSNLSLRY